MGKHQHKQLHAAYLWEVKAAPEKKKAKYSLTWKKQSRKLNKVDTEQLQ
jgi:hypothetical protein